MPKKGIAHGKGNGKDENEKAKSFIIHNCTNITRIIKKCND
jgi:hypothetical protein